MSDFVDTHPYLVPPTGDEFVPRLPPAEELWLSPGDRFELYRKEGRLIRKAWTAEVDGRYRACWLAALAPQTGVTRDVTGCPADLFPDWFARLVPELDDRCPVDKWDALASQFSDLAHRWHILSPADWERAEWRIRTLVFRRFQGRLPEEGPVAEAAGEVEFILSRLSVNGGEPTSEELEYVQGVARLFEVTSIGYYVLRTSDSVQTQYLVRAVSLLGDGVRDGHVYFLVLEGLRQVIESVEKGG